MNAASLSPACMVGTSLGFPQSLQAGSSNSSSSNSSSSQPATCLNGNEAHLAQTIANIPQVLLVQLYVRPASRLNEGHGSEHDGSYARLFKQQLLPDHLLSYLEDLEAYEGHGCNRVMLKHWVLAAEQPQELRSTQ